MPRMSTHEQASHYTTMSGTAITKGHSSGEIDYPISLSLWGTPHWPERKVGEVYRSEENEEPSEIHLLNRNRGCVLFIRRQNTPVKFTESAGTRLEQ